MCESDASEGARVPSLWALSARVCLERAGDEDTPYGAYVDELVSQNACNERAAELAALVKPDASDESIVLEVDSPPQIVRRPPLVRQNAFRVARESGATRLPPLPPRSKLARSDVEMFLAPDPATDVLDPEPIPEARRSMGKVVLRSAMARPLEKSTTRSAPRVTQV